MKELCPLAFYRLFVYGLSQSFSRGSLRNIFGDGPEHAFVEISPLPFARTSGYSLTCDCVPSDKTDVIPPFYRVTVKFTRTDRKRQFTGNLPWIFTVFLALHREELGSLVCYVNSMSFNRLYYGENLMANTENVWIEMKNEKNLESQILLQLLAVVQNLFQTNVELIRGNWHASCSWNYDKNDVLESG